MSRAITQKQAIEMARLARRQGDAKLMAEVLAALQHEAASQLMAGRTDVARSQLVELVELCPTNPVSVRLLGLSAMQAGYIAEAEVLLRQCLTLDENAADGWSNLGAALLLLGRTDEAIVALERALRLDPDSVHAHNTMGMIRIQRHQSAMAFDHFSRALSIQPDNLAALRNLILSLKQLGRLKEAQRHVEQLLDRNPRDVEAMIARAEIWVETGSIDRAIEQLRDVLAIEPGSATAANNLANLLSAEGRLGEALSLLDRLIENNPQSAVFHLNRGSVLRSMAESSRALSAYRHAIALDPGRSATHQDIITVLAASPEDDGRMLQHETSRWVRNFTEKLARCSHGNFPEPERRLRVGYVSADFRRHAAGFFLEPMIAAHDPGSFEIFCYSNRRAGDQDMMRMQTLPASWRQCWSWNDDDLIEQIQADGIDILVDCGGHAAGNRLLAFARKPAPIQMTTLLGHGASTGLPDIDYLIADPVVVPEGAEMEFTEKVIRLPFFAPFRPDPDWPAPDKDPSGKPVLACVGDPARIGQDVIRAWAAILDQRPDARLIFKHPAYGDTSLKQHWRSFFAPLAGRATFEGVPGGWARHMDFYAHVTAVLDTAPATGGTSTLIPLWMGVPVLSMVGARTRGRFGASILTTLSLEHLLASDASELVLKALSLLQDTEGRASLRAGLREHVARSVLCNSALLMRTLEAEYRRVWRAWCNEAGAKS